MCVCVCIHISHIYVIYHTYISFKDLLVIRSHREGERKNKRNSNIPKRYNSINSRIPWLVHKWKWKLLSHVRLFATPWTVACQTLRSMEFSLQEYWSRLPFPSLGDLSNPGSKPRSPELQADSLPSEPLPSPPTRGGVAGRFFTFFTFFTFSSY